MTNRSVRTWLAASALCALTAVWVVTFYRVTHGASPDPASTAATDTTAAKADAEVGRAIDLLFRDFEQEEFHLPDGPYNASGWMMPLRSGAQIQRCCLQRAAEPIIARGPAAVPHLYKWVLNEDPPVRYITIYSLERITGVRTRIPHLRRHDLREDQAAVARWQQWMASHRR
jgi:hypothetical protein